MNRISKTVLNKRGKGEHPWLVLDLRGNTFSFLPLGIIFVVGFVIYGIYYVEVSSL